MSKFIKCTGFSGKDCFVNMESVDVIYPNPNDKNPHQADVYLKGQGPDPHVMIDASELMRKVISEAKHNAE